jgi:hypothetical protein
MMASSTLRWTVAILGSIGVLLQIMALTLHWEKLTTRARRVSISACFVLAPVAAGSWYAVSHKFPPSPWIQWIALGLLIFDLAVLYRLPSGG